MREFSPSDIWIDVFRKFGCDINKYHICLVIVYFGECTWPVAFERTHLQGLTHSRSWDIWIDVHVVFRWFQPYGEIWKLQRLLLVGQYHAASATRAGWPQWVSASTPNYLHRPHRRYRRPPLSSLVAKNCLQLHATWNFRQFSCIFVYFWAGAGISTNICRSNILGLIPAAGGQSPLKFLYHPEFGVNWHSKGN